MSPRSLCRTVPLLISVLLLLADAPPGLAQHGGIVLRDQTPIYAHSKGDKVEFTAAKDTAVARINDFEEKDGRVHVMYFNNPEQKGLDRRAWMNPADLERFEYDCGCDKRGKCSAITFGFSSEWTECFKKAKDEKLAELAQGPAPAGSAATGQSKNPKALTNDDVIALTKAGLGDEIVLSKVTQAPETDFDTSVDGGAAGERMRRGVRSPLAWELTASRARNTMKAKADASPSRSCGGWHLAAA